VAVNPLLSCGQCPPCASSHRNACERRRLVGIHRPGGFAEAVAVPASALVPLPEGLDPRLGALTEPLANGVHAVALGSLRGPAAAAIIIGAGTIGLAALQAALLSGIPHVTVAEPNEPRRRQAAALGAHQTSASADELPAASADLVIDAVGRAETRARAVELTRSAGVCVAVGLHSDASALSFGDLIRREIAVQGSYGYTDDEFGRALGWLAAGEAGIGPLEPLLPLEAGPAAFAELARGPTGHIKVFLGGSG
jgi:threonine dehydrogenase-like Zn-dependent dehydrogenase